MRRYGRLAGVEVTTHHLRHLKARVMLNAGAQLSEVQDLLGHASPATTKMIYAPYTKQHLREAFDKYSVPADELARQPEEGRVMREPTPGKPVPRLGLRLSRVNRVGKALVLLLCCIVLATACAGSEPPKPASPPPQPTSAGALAFLPTPTPWPTLTPTPKATATATLATPTAGPSPTPSPLDDILARTIRIRGISNHDPVRAEFIPRDQVRDYLLKTIDREHAQVQIEAEKGLYVLFDLLRPSDDLYEMYIGMMTEQVLGFYEFEGKEMRVVGTGQSLSTLDELTLSHEYVHALQDQNFRLGARMQEVADHAEQALALQALSEGDATVSMALYAREYKTAAQIAQMQQQAAGVDQEKLQSAPQVVQVNTLFPYLQGAAFVSALLQNGGWAAVDQAFRTPPTTTEQVLHPEKYIAGEGPEKVTLPDLSAALGSGWSVLDGDTNGELGWLQYLSTALPGDRAGRAAAGWGGDQFTLLRGADGQYAMAALTVWDSAADAADFHAGLRELWTAKKRGEIETEGSTVRWKASDVDGLASLKDLYVLVILTPDANTTNRLAAKFPGF